MDKTTIVVNLFPGPGTGKSTGAAYIFSKLKMAGVDAEYVSEFAKENGDMDGYDNIVADILNELKLINKEN